MTRTKQIIVFFHLTGQKLFGVDQNQIILSIPTQNKALQNFNLTKGFFQTKVNTKPFVFLGSGKRKGKYFIIFLIKARSDSKNRNLKTNKRFFFLSIKSKSQNVLIFSFPSQKILMT